MAASLAQNAKERSRVRIIIVLFTLLLAVLVFEEFATPFVVTVHDQGCWTVETIGLFQTVNVHGCGNGSWIMFDLFAYVRSSGPANTVAPTIFLSQGPVGGACVGGSDCSNLGSFQVPSPVNCSGCAITRGWPNPLAIFTSSNSSSCAEGCYSSTLGSLAFFTLILLIYLAVSLMRTPKIYTGYIRNWRETVGWNSLSIRRKAIIVFALGFFVFRTLQFVATIYYVSIGPVATLAFPFEEILTIIVAIWLIRYLLWSIPFRPGFPGYAVPRFGSGAGESGTSPSPESSTHS